MKKQNKAVRFSPLLLVLVLTACNGGSSTGSSGTTPPGPNNNGSLEEFTGTLDVVTDNNSIPANYQHSFSFPESLGVFAVNYEYFADESCNNKVYASVMSSTGSASNYKQNTYRTTGVTNIFMCNQFNYQGNLGCYGEWLATVAMQSIKSTRYTYVFTKGSQNLVNYGNCKYNPAIGTEAIADYTYAYGPSQFCMESDKCGYSMQYQADILQTASAWVLGSNVVNQQGISDTQGMPSQNNTPGARSRGGIFYDQSGNVYLFGGYGVGQDGKQGYLNDLWQYTPNANTWTWVTGSSSTTYFGGPSINEADFAYWTVPNSNGSSDFYVFGGTASYPYTYMNSMVKYNTATQSWTTILGTVSGSNQAVTQQANIPGATSGASSVRIGSKLYLFGGYGFIYGNTPGLKNQLWVYDTANPTAKWTLLAGSNQTLNALSVTSDSAAAPGARQHAAMWVGSNGMIYMYGGSGYLDQAPGVSCPAGGCQLSDLWQYNPSANQWSIISTGAYNSAASYGTRLYNSATNTPGSRDSATTWVDAQGNLWLYGGFVSTAGGADNVYYNDLWKYTPSTGNWTWVTGSSYDITQAVAGNNGFAAIYGTRNLATNAAQAGGKAGAMGIADNSTGNLWLIGGYGFGANNNTAGYLNDVWKITPVATY